MMYRAVNRSEFQTIARRMGSVTPTPQERPAPLHTEAITEAGLILAATIGFVTLVQCALLAFGVI